MRHKSSIPDAMPEIGFRLNELFKPPLLSGHRIQPLINGDQIFSSMLQAIAEAQQEICFETFIYSSGEIAQQFATALIDAGERGVKIFVLLDWWGAKDIDVDLIEHMHNAGVSIRFFNPLRWWQLHRMNYRTHRKILVVDRKLAFTGGVGIAKEWQGNARSPDEWYDIHYRIMGPIVRNIREAFRELWSEVLQEPLLCPDDDTPPARHSTDTVAAQVLSSSPRGASELIYQLFRYALDTATDSVQITTAYFVPDQDMISAIISAVERGVKVEVMVPGPHIDSQIVRYSSKASWGKLLSAGVRILIYQPTMLHAKTTIIDNDWTILGSANFDNRSFSLNDEIILNVCSEEFTATHRKIFIENCEHCQLFSYEDWRRRGLISRLKEVLSDFLRPHL